MAWRTSCVVGLGLSSSSALADSTMPGVQKPHCVPPCSTSACWIGCSRPAVTAPSMVTMSRPGASSASIRQAFTAAPSTSTVHVPQLPLPQPSLVPVRPMRSRSRSSSVSRVSARTVCCSPLTVQVMGVFMRSTSTPSCRAAVGERARRQHRDQRAAVVGGAARVGDGTRVGCRELAGRLEQGARGPLAERAAARRKSPGPASARPRPARCAPRRSCPRRQGDTMRPRRRWRCPSRGAG